MGVVLGCKWPGRETLDHGARETILPGIAMYPDHMQTPFPLGRNVNHDPRSLAYPFVSAGTTPVAVRHLRNVPIFDQGQLGSCTGNAALGCLASDPFWGTLRPADRVPHDWSETGAVSVYSDATKLDKYTGTYPPTDTGSDGLSVAQVLRNRGWINGYTHVLSGTDGIAQALQSTPLIVGVPWYDSMFTPGRLSHVVEIAPGAAVAGGHEFVIDQFIPGYPGTQLDAQPMFGCQNSWGTGWGDGGRFYLTDQTLARLLSEDGDATVFTPLTAQPPQPIEDPALARLVSRTSHWINSPVPWIGAQGAQRELKRYLKDVT